MKKLLAIMGSSRRHKNTEVMLDAFISGLAEDWEVEKFIVTEMDFKRCLACDGCAKDGSCVVRDDMDKIYGIIPEADAMVFAAPIYFNSIPGEAKNLVDRTQNYWTGKYVLGQKGPGDPKRPAVFLACGGAPSTRDQFIGGQLVMDYFFKACNFTYKGDYLISHTDAKPVKERDEVLEELKVLGRDIDENGFYSIQR